MLDGDDLKAPGGLAALPVPVSTPGFNSAPYLTATLCVTRDPESGVQNMGTYRAALKAADRLVVRMVAREATGAGGFLHWLKYRERKQPMPIAIVIGAAPVVMFTGPQKLAIDLDELGVAGGLAGEPIRTVRCKTVDLHVPADAEIVIEGLIDPQKLEPEAPFGESNGYVALEAFNMPMQVTAITRKKKPVFCSIISQVTPSESSVIKKVAYEPLFLAHLRDALAIKGVLRVAMHERLTNLRPVIFLQIAYGTPRTEVWRALHAAATLMSNCGKIVVAVSDDVDPASVDAVLWSLAYRSNPREDVQLVPYRGGVQGAQYGPEQIGFEHADRRHAQAPDGAARSADARAHGARAATLAAARAASAHRHLAVARLPARRLDRDLGKIRAPRRRRRLGAFRPGDARPPARRRACRRPRCARSRRSNLPLPRCAGRA